MEWGVSLEDPPLAEMFASRLDFNVPQVAQADCRLVYTVDTLIRGMNMILQIAKMNNWRINPVLND